MDASASLPFTKGFNAQGAAPQREAAPTPEEVGGSTGSVTRPDLKDTSRFKRLSEDPISPKH